jgi:hypothetical protein
MEKPQFLMVVAAAAEESCPVQVALGVMYQTQLQDEVVKGAAQVAVAEPMVSTPLQLLGLVALVEIRAATLS